MNFIELTAVLEILESKKIPQLSVAVLGVEKTDLYTKVNIKVRY